MIYIIHMYVCIYIYTHAGTCKDPEKLTSQERQQVDGKAGSKVQIFQLLVR